MERFATMLTEYRQNVDYYLENLMAESDMLPDLKKAISYSLLSGGKRIRPILTLLTCELVEGQKEAAQKVGAALEFIHTYSLIHDDLPAMDDDEFRRGQKTNHLVFGEGLAILAGDALLTEAFTLLTGVNLSGEKRCQLIKLISTAAGPAGMVGGQVLDLQAEGKNIDLNQLKKIHQKKTGELFKAAILGGALCGQPQREEWQALEKYATNLGLTFQIVDDILDVTGDSEKLGKEVGQDEKRGKNTYPSLLGLAEAQDRAEEVARKARESLKIFGENAADLSNLVTFVLKRSY